MGGDRFALEHRCVGVPIADELTGLPSARAFALALERQAAVARRYDRPGVVMLLATPRAGDAGCRAVAQALRDRARTTDLLSRLEGCTFAILLPESGAAQARQLAGELVVVAARAAGMPAAAGIACFPDAHGRPAGALLADADAALATARGAVPPVAVFDARAAPLRIARPGGALVVERAPVIDLRTGAIDHHAVRYRLDGGADLLGRSDPFGLGRLADRRAVEYALLVATEERAPLVVPLTPGAAADRDFADWMVAALAGEPEAGAQIVVAVPELAALADVAAVRSLAARIGEFGGRLALDHFGRLGAFALLKALPVRQVRLEPALVRGLPHSERDRAVVLALVHAAEALGAEPVATGVDGEAELTAVRGFGITLAQGAVAAASGQL
jgi:EAL domain-containing protein (putative c-di-GMP-specific phosphodiesterase class I)/GGDEF domain-containing protein